MTVPYAALALAHVVAEREARAERRRRRRAAAPRRRERAGARRRAEQQQQGQRRPGALGSFVRAAVYDGPACVRELLKAKSDPNAPDLVNASPLHKATANGDARALRLLLGGGADIDWPNMYGDTCMHRAVENSRLATVTELLKHGADLDKPNRKGDTPLHLACAMGHEKLVKALLNAGALAMVYNMRGYVPMHTAIACGQKKVLEILVKYHEGRRLAWATLCVAKTNDTPLHVAVRDLRVADMMFMVNQGGFSAGLVMKNIEGRDPLKLLKEAKKLLSALNKFRRRSRRAAHPREARQDPDAAAQLAEPDGDPRAYGAAASRSDQRVSA